VCACVRVVVCSCVGEEQITVLKFVIEGFPRTRGQVED
jgi:hypothetical protein